MSADAAEPIGPTRRGGDTARETVPDQGAVVERPRPTPRRGRLLRLVPSTTRPARAPETTVIPIGGAAGVRPAAPTSVLTAPDAATSPTIPLPVDASRPGGRPADRRAPLTEADAADAAEADPDVDEAAEAVRAVWPHVTDSEARIAHWFGALLFSLAPGLRSHFPAQADAAARRLLRATLTAMSVVDRPAELDAAVPALARELRTLGLEPDADEALGVSLVGAVREFAGQKWALGTEGAWVRAFTLATRPARSAVAGLPGVVGATVVAHRRLSWDLAVVVVEPDVPVPYRPGQSVTVEVPQRPRMWRHLTPAGVPRQDGRLEFHVRAVVGGWVSRSLVAHSRSGERWRIGPAEGVLTVDPVAERELLVVVGGTGASVALALCEDLAAHAAAGRGVRPTTVIVGGRTPEDLHTLDRFIDLAEQAPWLAVVGVCESDPFDTELAPGTVAEAVTRSGPWLEHDVVVAGSPDMIRTTTAALLVDGTPLDRIHYDPFTDDGA